MSPNDYNPNDEHQRCRQLQDRLKNEILKLEEENNSLKDALKLYEQTPKYTIKRPCYIATKTTGKRKMLVAGDKIILFSKTES
jgi:hypothetical protein